MSMRVDPVLTDLIAEMQGLVTVSRLDFGLRSLFIFEINVSLFWQITVEQRKGLVIFYFSASLVS